MSSSDTISAFIGEIYDCVIAPERWAATLHRICAELRFANGVLASNALPSGEASMFVSVGIESDWLARIPGDSADVLDLWGGPARVHQYPLDEPIVQSQATNRATWATNRWYTRWAEPQGLMDAVTIVVARDSTAVGNVTFGRHRTAGEVADGELDMLRLIAPHLRRAIAISKLLDVHMTAAATFASALETFEVGVVLVDDQLGIVHANAAARAMLAADQPIRSHGGVLTLPSAATTTALRTAVALAARSELELGRRGIGIPIRDVDGTPRVAHVLPLRRPEIRKGLIQHAAAAVFIAPANAPPRLPGDALALLYDLTPAEVRVLELIADGKTPAETARTLSIAVSTVKTHLLRVFDKTGCSRQAGLVKLVASLSLLV